MAAVNETEQLLAELAVAYGVETGYTNIWGQTHHTSAATLRAVLSALGESSVAGEAPLSPDALRTALQRRHDAPWLSVCDPVCVQPKRLGTPVVTIRLPKREGEMHVQWVLTSELGDRYEGSFIQSDLHWQTGHQTADGRVMDAYRWAVPLDLPWGYHALTLSEGDIPLGRMTVILTPERCYQPDTLAGDGKTFGPAVQLYALHSETNWGMGDWADLARLMHWAGENGAGIVGINPMHALFPHQAEHTSPYSPSSRSFLNSLYLNIEAIPEYAEAAHLLKEVGSTVYQSKIRDLRARPLVDYTQVARLKSAILEPVFDHFRQNHLRKQTARAQGFNRFLREGGKALHDFAVFQTLHESFCRKDETLWSWQSWPSAYRSPDTPEVAAFASEHADRVLYYQYLQWLSHEQLIAVSREAREEGLAVGLYMDLAVGSDASGADVWMNPDCYALGMTVGCPPDECNLKGQNWGLPPWLPGELQRQGHGPFIRALKQNMQYTRALRIDHVMGLMRLFWIPRGAEGTDGTYVHYPLEDLMGILALESHRNECLIIGEDLGTVAPAMREAMTRWGVYTYRIFYFERNDESLYKLPGEYPSEALVALSTHDLPTFTGFWNSEDVAIRTELDLYPSEDFRHRQMESRQEERRALMRVLARQHRLPEDMGPEDPLPPVSTPLVTATYAYLADTPGKVLMFQLEDIFDQSAQVNLPGTVDEHPNWRRKLTVALERWGEDDRLKGLVDTLRTIRPARVLSCL